MKTEVPAFWAIIRIQSYCQSSQSIPPNRDIVNGLIGGGIRICSMSTLKISPKSFFNGTVPPFSFAPEPM